MNDTIKLFLIVLTTTLIVAIIFVIAYFTAEPNPVCEYVTYIPNIGVTNCTPSGNSLICGEGWKVLNPSNVFVNISTKQCK